jgi:hypothetical protein
VETTKIKLAKPSGLFDSHSHDQCITNYNKICPMGSTTSQSNSVRLCIAEISMGTMS